MPSPKTQPARGMRDFLPADVRKREYVIGVIKQVYERYGFEPLETPAVENIETLMGKYGEEGNQLIFKILKRGEHEKTGEADLALRYDLTVPLARVVAQYQNELPKFFKRYQIQPVWRADRPARGRFREFYQCDVDVLGSRSMVVEAELIAAASDALVALGFNDFTILLNHRKVLEKIMKVQGIDPSQFSDAVTALDKLDKIPPQRVRDELEAQGIFFSGWEELLSLLHYDLNALRAEHASDDNETWNTDMLDRLLMAMGGSEEAHANQGLNELRHILKYAAESSAKSRLRLAPNLARGLSYYTGTIMEIRVPDLAGSLGGGGRYDNLVGMFLGKDVPACGFSLGLERIIVVMSERGMFPTIVQSPADVMVTIPDMDSVAESLMVANELRRQGKRVDVYPQPDKLGKQISYAAERGIEEVAIVGAEERKLEIVSLKDMRTREQRHERRTSWRRRIFAEFLEKSGLAADLSTISDSDIRSFDFSCEVGGDRLYFETKEIVDEKVARTYNISMETMQPVATHFSQDRPLRQVFQTVGARAIHIPGVRINFLAYYDRQHSPPGAAQFIQKTVGPIAEFMIDSGDWERLWVYDSNEKEVLWIYPYLK